jgi:hypothetical protein
MTPVRDGLVRRDPDRLNVTVSSVPEEVFEHLRGYRHRV